jgi:hypothetical protein
MIKGANKSAAAAPAAEAKTGPTPLVMVKQQQARMQHREVSERRADTNGEMPGHSVPSNRRKQPQRQMG